MIDSLNLATLRLQRNVADQADAPSPRSGAAEMMTLSAEELGHFLDFVGDDRLYGAWVLGCHHGAPPRRGPRTAMERRRSGLRPASRAPDACLSRLRDQVLDTEDQPRPPIGFDRRHDRHSSSVSSEAPASGSPAWGPAYQDSGLVVTRENGALVHPDRFTQLFDKHVKNSGLPRIRLHDLRHTHASLALAAGVYPKVVSERLGDATVAFTLDVYSHAVPALQQEAADRVAALIFKPAR